MVTIEFPITDLLDKEYGAQWIIEHFYPKGFRCPVCTAGVDQAREFRSQLTVCRCCRCQATFNLYTDTLFQQHHLTPMQVVLLIRGVLRGEPATTLAAEQGLNYQTVLTIRHDLTSPDFIAALVTGHTFYP